VRESRRLGSFDAQVIVLAAETLVSRIVAPGRRFHRQRAADRFTRAVAVPDLPRLRP
jgi:hypothetical protein